MYSQVVVGVRQDKSSLRSTTVESETNVKSYLRLGYIYHRFGQIFSIKSINLESETPTRESRYFRRDKKVEGSPLAPLEITKSLYWSYSYLEERDMSNMQ